MASCSPASNPSASAKARPDSDARSVAEPGSAPDPVALSRPVTAPAGSSGRGRSAAIPGTSARRSICTPENGSRAVHCPACPSASSATLPPASTSEGRASRQSPSCPSDNRTGVSWREGRVVFAASRPSWQDIIPPETARDPQTNRMAESGPSGSMPSSRSAWNSTTCRRPSIGCTETATACARKLATSTLPARSSRRLAAFAGLARTSPASHAAHHLRPVEARCEGSSIR